MSLKAFFCSHQWKGCTCAKCARVRDSHHWLDDGCRCRRCNLVRGESHDWSEALKCKSCGTSCPLWVDSLARALTLLPITSSQIAPHQAARLGYSQVNQTFGDTLNTAAKHIRVHYPIFGRRPEEFQVNQELRKPGHSYRSNFGEVVRLQFSAGHHYDNLEITRYSDAKYVVRYDRDAEIS